MFWTLAEAGVIRLFISRQSIGRGRSKRDSQASKNGGSISSFYCGDLSLVIVDDPSPAEIQAAALVIHIKDAPILAAAKKAQVDFLITLDKKHFLSGKTGYKASSK